MWEARLPAPTEHYTVCMNKTNQRRFCETERAIQITQCSFIKELQRNRTVDGCQSEIAHQFDRPSKYLCDIFQEVILRLQLRSFFLFVCGCCFELLVEIACIQIDHPLTQYEERAAGKTAHSANVSKVACVMHRDLKHTENAQVLSRILQQNTICGFAVYCYLWVTSCWVKSQRQCHLKVKAEF